MALEVRETSTKLRGRPSGGYATSAVTASSFRGTLRNGFTRNVTHRVPKPATPPRRGTVRHDPVIAGQPRTIVS
jgi:hypothetical protein